MESVYVMSGKEIYKDMTKFWGKLFGINFALDVTTGLTMEFQFGTNWSYYSHYVGDVFGISACYILKGRDLEFAKRSFSVAAGYGLASILSVIVLGDESGYELGDVQTTRLAALEAEWETHEPPAGFTLFGLPDQAAAETHATIKIPWALASDSSPPDPWTRRSPV